MIGLRSIVRPLQTSHNGAAIKIELYAPITRPNAIATANPWIDCAPRIKNEITANNVVNDVFKLLVKD